MKGLGALGIELLFGLGLLQYLRWLARPTYRLRPRVGAALDGPVTLPSDTVGLA